MESAEHPRGLTKGHIIAIGFFVLFLPLVAILTYSAWLGAHPSNSLIIGVGRVETHADSAALTISINVPYVQGVDNSGQIRDVAAAIVAYLTANGIDSSRISTPYSSSIIVGGFTKADNFSGIQNLMQAIPQNFSATVSARYMLSAVPPEVQSQAITEATADARGQAESVAQSLGRTVVFFTDGVCAIQVMDAGQSFNPTSCSDKAYDEGKSADKVVVAMTHSGAAFSFSTTKK